MADEEKLLLRLLKKEYSALNEAIELYTPYLSTVLYNMAGAALKKEDAEEIISDVFVCLWKNAERIDLKKGGIRCYIAACARNFALKRLKKARNDVCLDDTEISTEDNFEDEKLYNAYLWEAVMSLGEPDNEIFVRYYKFGEKLKTIAKATHLSVSAVKSRMFRGKRKLKILLSEEEACHERKK